MAIACATDDSATAASAILQHASYDKPHDKLPGVEQRGPRARLRAPLANASDKNANGVKHRGATCATCFLFMHPEVLSFLFFKESVLKSSVWGV